MTESPAPENALNQVVLTSEQIAGLLPHRYPFALVDRVIAHEPGVSATAIKNITINEPQFQGHFPDRPLMPGVLIVEAMAQVGGLIVTQMPDLPKGLFVLPGRRGTLPPPCGSWRSAGDPLRTAQSQAQAGRQGEG